MKHNQNKYGKSVFWTNLAVLQHIEECKKENIKNSILMPVSKLKKRFHSIIGSWIVIVAVSLSLLTMKILIENMMRLR